MLVRASNVGRNTQKQCINCIHKRLGSGNEGLESLNEFWTKLTVLLKWSSLSVSTSSKPSWICFFHWQKIDYSLRWETWYPAFVWFCRILRLMLSWQSSTWCRSSSYKPIFSGEFQKHSWRPLDDDLSPTVTIFGFQGCSLYASTIVLKKARAFWVF